MRLGNKVALITGGYGGMGRASARLFAREGATVFVAGRNHERGNELVAEINGSGGKAHFVELDTTNQDHWNAAVAEVKEKAGELHVLMNVVGSNALVRFPDVDIEQLNKIFEVNVTGTIRGIQTCAPLMKESAAVLSSTSARSPALRETSVPAIPRRNGRLKVYRGLLPMSMRIGAFAQMSFNQVGLKQT